MQRVTMDRDKDRYILGVTPLTSCPKVEEWTEIPQWRLRVRAGTD